MAGWLDELMREHGVVGASVAVWDGGAIRTWAGGLAHAGTGHPVSERTVFQIGSITKLVTAVQTVARVESGVWSLDDTVAALVPELRDDAWARCATVRQVLAHTAGLDADLHLPDTGRGADALARFAVSCAALPLLHEPGDHVSYCNAGFSLLGRALEVESGLVWDTLVHREVAGPLGMVDTVSLPEDVILRSVAVGHGPTRTPPGHRVTTTWSVPRSAGPSGGLVATARDVAVFAGALLRPENAAITASAVELMSTPVEPLRPGTQARGLGWELVAWPHGIVWSHDGANTNQCAAVRVFADQGLAIAVLTNWARAPQFNDAVVARLAADLRSLDVPSAPVSPPGVACDLAIVEGTFARLHVRQRVLSAGGRLVLEVATGERIVVRDLHPLGPAAAVVDDPIFGPQPVSWVDDLLVLQGRVARRVDASPTVASVGRA
jgi:CubicO group peptidase (beta-lactamase class C family)